MNLYLLERQDQWTYDEFDACIVCAADEEDAKNMRPTFGKSDRDIYVDWDRIQADFLGKPRGHGPYGNWVVFKKDLKATLIGKASESMRLGCILGSFNAG